MKQRSISLEGDVKNILISGAIKNPRKINQFLNNIVAMYRLAEFKEKDKILRPGSITENTPFLTKIIVIRHEWPNFYKLLEKNEHLLDEINKIINDENPMSLIQEYKDVVNEWGDEGLYDFLNGTQYCVTTDIKPFLRLSQESFNAELPEIDQFQLAVNNNNFDLVLRTIGNANEQDQEGIGGSREKALH